MYRVELTPVKPTLTIGIPRVDRYSQTRQTIVVPRGNRYGTLILATRADFGGPIELLPQNLIPGVTMTAQPMHPSMNLMPVVFEAAEDAPIDGDADRPAREAGRSEATAARRRLRKRGRLRPRRTE